VNSHRPSGPKSLAYNIFSIDSRNVALPFNVIIDTKTLCRIIFLF